MEALLRADARTDQLSDRQTLVAQMADHGPMLLAAARVITLDDDEARDIVQTTFEIAMRRIETLRDPAALRAWLLKIEMREAFRVVRRLRARRGRERALTPADDAAADPDLSAEVRSAIEALPRRIRAAIVLHHLVGLSVRDTAVALGVSENTIKSELKSGLARLRETMA